MYNIDQVQVHWGTNYLKFMHIIGCKLRLWWRFVHDRDFISCSLFLKRHGPPVCEPVMMCSSANGTFPSAAGHVATTTLLADMQTFPLQKSSKIYALLLTFATKHSHYLRNLGKGGIGSLSLSAQVPNRSRLRIQFLWSLNSKVASSQLWGMFTLKWVYGANDRAK